MKQALQITAAVALSMSTTVWAQGASDDFNRPNGGNMGFDWTEMNGDTVIESNQGRGNSIFDIGWMSHTSFAAPYADVLQQIDAFTSGAGGESVALVAGLDTSSWQGIYVKLQDNDGDALFDRIFFESAINAGSWNGGPTVWYDLATPTATARMKLSFVNGGDVARCEVTDLNTGVPETFEASGILTSPFPPNGTSVAIAHLGKPFFDDWSASASPLFSFTDSISVSAGGSQVLDMSVGAAHAGRVYLILGSASGVSRPTVIGSVAVPLVVDSYTFYTLENPNSAVHQGTLGILGAVGEATATIQLPAGSFPALAGLTLHHAGLVLDLAQGLVDATNAVELKLLP